MAASLRLLMPAPGSAWVPRRPGQPVAIDAGMFTLVPEPGETVVRDDALPAQTANSPPRTTVPALAGQQQPADLVRCDFTAPAPNRRWVADITKLGV